MRLFMDSKKGLYLINMYVFLNKKSSTQCFFYATNLKSRPTQKEILGEPFLSCKVSDK